MKDKIIVRGARQHNLKNFDLEIPRRARELGLDILHVPFNFLPVGRCRKVIHVHDLAFLHLKDSFTFAERQRMTWMTNSPTS